MLSFSKAQLETLHGKLISSDIIRIRFEKIRKYSLFELEYEFESIRLLLYYSNSKFELENVAELFEIIRK